MFRNIIHSLIDWKNSPRRKPLILAGARQVGKTYILKQFGKQEFENVAYLNCDDNERAKGLFDKDYDMKRILLAISAITEQTIIPGRTLIILDEI
jgi:predicted AAA+ superfamily ATPase